MLHLVHLRPHYFVHSVITIMRIKLGCPVLKKQLYCPSFLWGNGGDSLPLLSWRVATTVAALCSALKGEAPNMKHETLLKLCSHALFTLKHWFPLGECTLRCDLLTVDRMLCTENKFFLVAYFYMPIVSKIS